VKLDGLGVIIKLSPLGDRDFVGRVFTSEFGVINGLFKSGQIAKSKPLVGQLGRMSWNARTADQLGSIHFECEKNLVAALFNSPKYLKYADSCFGLLASMLPEHEQYERLFSATLKFFTDMDYLEWERSLLTELGYGLDLDKCGNCGKKDNLMYISPKTGRAICADCGKAYEDKLFGFPLDLNTTKYFLEQISELPEIRKIF
jgi:DNA repair protein RecO (recombination protein O)